MKPRLLYVELMTGYTHKGPAWIGKGHFSRTGDMVYFDGKAFKRAHSRGFYVEIETGEAYWISGIKKDMQDRHWAGSGKIKIDRAILEEYLLATNQTELPNGRYEIIALNPALIREKVHQLENLQ